MCERDIDCRGGRAVAEFRPGASYELLNFLVSAHLQDFQKKEIVDRQFGSTSKLEGGGEEGGERGAVGRISW